MDENKNKDKIIIIDFGSQVTKLIARRIREFGVLSEIITLGELKYIKNFNRIKGIILSGGPATVTNRNFPNIPKSLFLRKIPILGICYGIQLIAINFGGKVKKGKKKKRIWKNSFIQKKRISFNNKIL